MKKTIILTGIGADCEMFLKNKKTNEIVSAEGFVQGTKEEPFVFDPSNNFFATSLDNVLAEFSIPPATNKVEFYNYLRKSIRYINTSIPKEYCTVASPAEILQDYYLQTTQAKKFGCEPDFNAYTGLQNNRPFAANPNLRSAGGHLHLGYIDPSTFDPFSYYDSSMDSERHEIIQALDLHIGVPSVILEPDNERKLLYGKAGAFRPKIYGLEYRTVSNFYLNSKKLTMWVYDAVTNAINWLNEGNVIDRVMATHISDVINSNDKQEAQNLIKTFNLQLA